MSGLSLAWVYRSHISIKMNPIFLMTRGGVLFFSHCVWCGPLHCYTRWSLCRGAIPEFFPRGEFGTKTGPKIYQLLSLRQSIGSRIFTLRLFNVMNHVDCLVNAVAALPPRNDPTWSWPLTFSMYCCTWLSNISLRMVASVFMRLTGLQFPFFVLTFPGFRIHPFHHAYWTQYGKS